jgi:hypothetical protein
VSRLYDRLFDSPAVSERFKALLRPATVVVGDPVSDYYFQGTDQEHWTLEADFPNIAPPLAAAFYDFRAPPGRFTRCDGRSIPWGGAARAWGALVVAQDVAAGEAVPVGPWRWPGLRWVVYVFAVVEYEKGRAEGPLLIHQIGVRPDGSPAVGPAYPNGVAAAATLPDDERGRRRHPDASDLDEEVGYRAHLFHTFLCTVLLTTCFMHCKNVAVRDAPAPPARLARAYRKRHGRPLTTYKVLAIDPMRQVLRREGQADETGLRRAVHLCRGHFVHYTEERPLFGKVAGTFWRPMHLRGSPSEGLALKDYRVRSPLPPAPGG